MGGLLSRWRKRQTTVDVLEGLEKEIQALEALKKGNVESQRRIVGGLILYSILAYIVAAVVFYLWFLPEDTSRRVISALPLLFFPVLIWFIKRFLHWYFINRITKNDSALEDLRIQKKEILEKVMETETYKKAKEILERFDPEEHKKLEKDESSAKGGSSPQVAGGPDLRQRKGANVSMAEHQMGTPRPPGHYTPRPGFQGSPVHGARNGQMHPQGTPMRFPPPGPPMPRPVLPRDRSVVDRFMEVLVGDGPQNRYALICKECHSHNGMALREEFEFITFRCCYCYTLNPAKKQRPRAPKLDYITSPRSGVTQKSSRTDMEPSTADQAEGSGSEVSEDTDNIKEKQDPEKKEDNIKDKHDLEKKED